MSVATKPSARTISTTLHDPDSDTETCATRRSRARAAASTARHRFTLRSEEHTSELQSLMRISYAVFCLKKKKKHKKSYKLYENTHNNHTYKSNTAHIKYKQ